MPKDDTRTPAAGRHDGVHDPETLRGAVTKKAQDSIDYYRKKKDWPRFWARTTRGWAIVLISLAGIVPLVDAAGLFGAAGNGAGNVDSGQIALLMAAGAAALVASDRFFGFSSTWARFTTTELTLQRALDRFVFDWALTCMAEDESADPRTLPMQRLELLRSFSMEVSRINEEETNVWVTEYQSALAALALTAQERKEAAIPGSIRIEIERGDAVTGPVTVSVDGQQQREVPGSIAFFGQIPPGRHHVEFVAEDADGTAVREARVADVLAGRVASLTVRLG